MNGISPSTINVDGNVSEWDSRDASSGVTTTYGPNTWYFTWDSTNFYAALKDTNNLNETSPVDANQLEIYIDTDSTQTGTNLRKMII